MFRINKEIIQIRMEELEKEARQYKTSQHFLTYKRKNRKTILQAMLALFKK